MTLLTGHSPGVAGAYALSSIVAALAAVWCGMRVARGAAAWPARVRAWHSGAGE
jgi:hypothetical protein